MDRWRMHKLGFLNFWLYDQEEFLLENGHILLRGNNGAGKSITTQSFIPFILDGNRRPERLDPFGSTAKKMDFYLLGDNEDTKEETGYLYLEFKKEGLEEYLTIGIGMRAKRGSGIDQWGFCLNDGRRIGPDGVRLYEKRGRQLIPLSRQQLKSLLDDDENWADNAEMYKALVNRRVFRFRDIRQYEQLLQMLLKVRKPKLSKDDFRPTALKEILNDSLRVLTDEDLSAMVSTMERMDSLEGTIRGCREAMQDARTIRNEYTRYNQYVLGRKGRAYLETRSAVQRLTNQLEDQRARCGELEKELAAQEQRKHTSAEAYQQAKAQRAAMGDDELSAKQSQLSQLLASCERLQSQAEQGEADLQRQKDRIYRKEIDLRELTQRQKDAQDGVRLALRELQDGNGVLELGQEHEAYTRQLQMGHSEADQREIRTALRLRRKQIDQVLRGLDRAGQARKLYDDACRTLDESDMAVRTAASTVKDAELQENGERDRLRQAFATWKERNVRLTLSEDGAHTVYQAVTRYSSRADWSAVCNLMDECVRRLESEWNAQKLRLQNTRDNLQQERQACDRELERLRNQPEPTPPRSPQADATRVQLAMRGVPCAPFYETIDFAPELSQDARDLLEAQLRDAGLLDALVVPPEHLDELRELLAEYPDRFLLPGAPVRDPVANLIPAGAETFRSVAAACLQSISQSDPEAETALLPDGRFRSGLIRGHSRGEGPAGYVGAAARRANRERQLQELEEKRGALTKETSALQLKIDHCDACLLELREEREQMPTAVDLDQALEMTAQARRTLDEAEAERERRLLQMRTARQSLNDLEQEVRAASAGLPYMLTVPAYEEAREAAEEYQGLLEQLESQCKELRYAAGAVQNMEDTIEGEREQADTAQRLSRALQMELETNRAAAGELRAFLGRPENQARARRLEELDREIEHQDRENRDAERECVRLAEQLNTAKEAVQGKRQRLLEATLNEHDLEAYFSEDLALGFSGLDGDQGLEACAREAVNRMQASDQDRSHEQVQDALRKNYEQHNSSVLRYRPELKLVFDAPEQPNVLRQRYCITLNWKGKDISLYEFIQALQAEIELTETLLEEQDRELFENILTETISLSLRGRIEESRKWTESMTALMSTLDTSMGLTFSLDWKAKKAEGGGELDTAQLVTLLNKDRALLSREDSQRVSSHFRIKVKKAREEAYTQGLSPNYADLIRTVLDYRNWYEFRLFYQREGEEKKELTDRVFNRFSGGEKAMAMYVPLFASVSAQYQKSEAPVTCPRLLALDEAFAGVDEKNIAAMFELVHRLDFDYIMNSQALWGCYACVDGLAIADLHRPANASVVTILRYRWNGQAREETP